MTCLRLAEGGPRLSRVGLTALFLLGLSPPLLAQLPTEGDLAERVLEPREEISRAMNESRFSLGPVRLTPRISIDEMTYDNNVYGSAENPKGDFRTTISAGVGLILPVNPNVFLRAGILPAYTWYAELVERRFLGGRYNASFLAFANRLTLEGSVGASREDVIFSSEAQGRVISNLTNARLGAELRLLARVFVYGEGRIQRYRFTGPGAEAAVFDPSTTDRTDQSVRAELRYRWTDSVKLGAGYEETRSEFVSQPQLYDNRERAAIATIYLERRRLFFRLSGGYSEIEAIHGSTIPPFSGVTGSSFASFTLFRPLDLQAFASRNITYGLSSPYYVALRYGGGIVLRVGWRITLKGFVTSGTDDYSTPFLTSGGQFVDRKDDVTNYGGSLDLLLTSRAQMRFTASEESYTSNVPENDRTFFRWFVSLRLGNLLP